jgi:hypothetical protein
MGKTIHQTIAVVGALLLVAGHLTYASAGELTGLVRDVCGAVLPGTSVTATNQAATMSRALVDGSGRYTLRNLATGSWTVTFELLGFETKRDEIQIADVNDPLEHNVRLLPDLQLKEGFSVSHADPALRFRKYSVRGVVTGRDGAPVSGATIRLRARSKQARTMTDVCSTDEIGRYILAGWSPTATQWRLSVEAQGYRVFMTQDLKLIADEPRTFDIRLQLR